MSLDYETACLSSVVEVTKSYDTFDANLLLRAMFYYCLVLTDWYFVTAGDRD